MPQIFSGWVFSRLNLKTGNKSELNILNTYPEVYFQSSQASAMELFLRKSLTVNTAIIRSSRLVVFSKKRCSHKLCKIHKKTPALESLFQWGFKSTEFKLIKRKIFRHMFSCEFCEISQNIIFKEPKKLSISAEKHHCRCSTRF